MSKKILIINAVAITVLLITLSFFVDDIMPFIYGAGALNVTNICVYAITSKDEKKK